MQPRHMHIVANAMRDAGDVLLQLVASNLKRGHVSQEQSVACGSNLQVRGVEGKLRQLLQIKRVVAHDLRHGHCTEIKRGIEK